MWTLVIGGLAGLAGPVNLKTDALVWEQVVGLLKAPELVRAEIDQRMEESLSTDPMRQRKNRLERELKRTGSQLDKLLDAYQADLIRLADLRSRAPEFRRRQIAMEEELEGVTLQALEKIRGLACQKLCVGQAQQLFLFGVQIQILVDALHDRRLPAGDLVNFVQKIVQLTVDRG
jgi:hypothetical protein